eukprot:1480009-Rhodomonas_salina.3
MPSVQAAKKVTVCTVQPEGLRSSDGGDATVSECGGSNPRAVERFLHDKFADRRVCTHARELFDITKD